MTPEQVLQGTQLALQCAQQMLADANARIIDLSAKLSMAQSSIAESVAAKPERKRKPTLEEAARKAGHG